MLYHILMNEYWPVYLFAGKVYCQECLPFNISIHDERVQPFTIELIQEYKPRCYVCEHVHKYFHY